MEFLVWTVVAVVAFIGDDSNHDHGIWGFQCVCPWTRLKGTFPRPWFPLEWWTRAFPMRLLLNVFRRLLHEKKSSKNNKIPSKLN